MKKIVLLVTIIIMLLSSVVPSFALSPLGYDDRIKNLVVLEYIPSTYVDEAEKPLTRVDYAFLISGFHQPHYYTKGMYMSGQTYKDVPTWANPYVDFCIKNDLIQDIDKNNFGAANHISKELFLEFLIKELGHDTNGKDIYTLAQDIYLLDFEEVENLKELKEFRIKDALYLIYNAFLLVPKGEQNIILAEQLAEKDLLNSYYLKERGLRYEIVSEREYYKYNKDKINMNPEIKSYEEGNTAEYGIDNSIPQMIIEGDYIYYVTADYNIDYLRIKERNTKTGKTRILVDKKGVYNILGKRKDYIYYVQSSDEIYNSGIYTGVHKLELRSVNVKTMEDRSVDSKETVNDYRGGIVYYLGKNYIYKLKEFRTLYSIPIEKLGSSKWESVYYNKDGINVITVGNDDSVYGNYLINDTSNPVTLIGIKPNGKLMEYGKYDYIANLIQLDEWLYISCKDLIKINKNTKEVQLVIKNSGIVNIQYPWLYYANDGYYRMKLDSETPLIQQVHYSYSDVYGTYGKLILYKDKAYTMKRYTDEVFKIFTIDMNTWKKKEILDNRK
ncbi:hypothetical protein KQI41_11755 [Tissierella pigra]|uniref:DUF5050 domain-containing protein n=1 Tax=Tissierella pigra TaxID=2607614 RepID=A0A6N7XIA4_9FIRM|nr:hypothetical protein [Tissierella pigra]MBU5427090.1 hypothetical protein [Tissierella pigra]MSU01759.1 hypothetical protein [Tissierella pigra]